ncbi:hypothetical protein D3C84_669870 [compost metagenome]
MLRRLEQCPEVVTDHVSGDLPPANRAANKGAHEILGVIEHELITRLGRDRFEGGKRVGPALRPITRQRAGLPVTAVEQALDPGHLRRAQRVGNVGLMNDHPLHRPQTVVKLAARIIVRASGLDHVNRLPGRRARSHPLKEMPRLAVLEIDVREKPVLVQPAPYQALPGTRRVEQVFPLHHLQRLFRARHEALLIDRRTGGQPALQRLVLLIGEAGDRQRHAFLRVGTRVAIKLGGHRAHVFPVQTQDDVFGQLGIGLQRRTVTQLKHARHQGRLIALGVEHRVKAHFLPGLLAARVIEQSSRCHGLAAITVIHRDFGRTARRTFATAEVELAGCIIAGMAGYTLFGEDRLDVAGVGNRRRTARGYPRTLRHSAPA